jgi:thiamine monophosphate synthase
MGGACSPMSRRLAGGCRIVYRDKISNKPEQLARAKALHDLTRRYGASLLINDDIALAVLVGPKACIWVWMTAT